MVQASLKTGSNPEGNSLLQRSMTDERRLWDIMLGHFSHHMLLVAHNLKLFSLLAERPRSLTDVAATLQLEHRPTQALLMAIAAMGFIQLEDGNYSLTQFAQDYLLEDSPTYFGHFLDMVSINHQVETYESLRKAVLTNTSQVYANGDLFASHQEQAALARAFTVAMHGHSMGTALGWTEMIDLSQHRVMLDVAGGSGAHSIAATTKWSNLSAIVAELPPVCEVANEYIARYGLQERIATHAFDMWHDPFPSADLHFYADVYHDWTPEQGAFLTRKSFENLQPGGRIILHEMLLNDSKTGPMQVANYNTAMLLWTAGQQYSETELVTLLKDAGFLEVEIIPSKSYWSLVTGLKPLKLDRSI